MFGISFFELLIVFVVALIAFGPEKLPEIARTLGRASGELRKHSNALRREFYNSVYAPAQDFSNRISSETAELRGVSTNLIESGTVSPSCSERPSEQSSSDPSSHEKTESKP